MNIVYLCLQPLSGHGASDAHVAGIVGGLRDSGQNVEVLTSLVGRRTLFRRLVEGVFLQMRALLAMHRADAAYIRMHPVAALTVLLLRKTPILVEVNGVPEDFYVAHPSLRRVAPVLEALLRYQLRRADHVLTVTSGLRVWVKTFQPQVRSVHVVSNAADPQLFRPGLPRPSDVPEEYVLFFGALAPWQGIDLATAAAAEPAWPNSIGLVVIGGGQEAHVVEEAQSAMPERVRFLGPRPRSELPAYVANALVTLIPKRYHATAAGQSPLKLYESLAAGVPVIATRLPGATDIEDLGQAVTTVESEPHTVAIAVAARAADRSAARTAGAAGREAVLGRHTWDHRAEAVLELLRRPLDQSDSRH